MNSLTRRSMSMARNAAQAGIDAAVTIAARTSSMAMPTLDLNGAQARENQLMVQEKIAAACEGAWAAQMALGNFWLRAAFGGVTSPNHVTHAMVDVAEAAMAPARRAVRANAAKASL